MHDLAEHAACVAVSVRVLRLLGLPSAWPSRMRGRVRKRVCSKASSPGGPPRPWCLPRREVTDSKHTPPRLWAADFFCQHHTSSRKRLRCCWVSRSPADTVAWCSINRCICGLIRKGGRQDRVHLQWRVCVHTRTRVHVRNRGRRGVVGAAPMKARRGATLSTPHTAYSVRLCFLQ